MQRLKWISIGVLGLLCGLFLAKPNKTPEVLVTCRPSIPERVPHENAILFWGNSLAFDHNWNLGELLVVNCARQGMTAQLAVSQMMHLPKISFDAVILVFGSVELLRNDHTLSEFSDAIQQIRQGVGEQYPNAEVIVLSVPNHTDSDLWVYGGTQALQNVNLALSTLSNTKYVDTSVLLAPITAPEATYDGVHLNKEGYLLVQKYLSELLKSLSSSNSPSDI